MITLTNESLSETVLKFLEDLMRFYREKLFEYERNIRDIQKVVEFDDCKSAIQALTEEAQKIRGKMSALEVVTNVFKPCQDDVVKGLMGWKNLNRIGGGENEVY